MSIPGAVTELNKEIATLTKNITRLTLIRDSLLESVPEREKSSKAPVSERIPPKKSKKKTASKKSVRVKATSVRTIPPATKRVVSAATRKKMSDAAKARSASKTASPA